MRSVTKSRSNFLPLIPLLVLMVSGVCEGRTYSSLEIRSAILEKSGAAFDDANIGSRGGPSVDLHAPPVADPPKTLEVDPLHPEVYSSREGVKLHLHKPKKCTSPAKPKAKRRYCYSS